MKILHNIGSRKNSNYNTRDEILDCKDPLSFDGVYLNVYENQDVLKGKDVTFFVMGDTVGKNNSFDIGMPLENFCDWNQIIEMVIKYNVNLGWHTWTHRDLTKLSDFEIIEEITPPFPMLYFAYPYGKFDNRVKGLVEKSGLYLSAYSVIQGNNFDPFCLPRQYLNW